MKLDPRAPSTIDETIQTKLKDEIAALVAAWLAEHPTLKDDPDFLLTYSGFEGWAEMGSLKRIVRLRARIGKVFHDEKDSRVEWFEEFNAVAEIDCAGGLHGAGCPVQIKAARKGQNGQ
jgi:hypothetical protein